MVKADDLIEVIQIWPAEWMNLLEEPWDNAIEEEELDTSLHGEGSGKDKEKEEEEEEEEDEHHEEEHHDEEHHVEDIQGGEDMSKEKEKEETKKTAMEKRKIQGKATIKRRKKHKEDKSK